MLAGTGLKLMVQPGDDSDCRPALDKPVNHVAVFEDEEHFSRLAGKVADLGLIPFDARSKPLDEGVLAALVSQRVDREFHICRELAGRVPVVQVCQDASFESRLAAARAGATAVLAEPIDIVELGAWFDGLDQTKRPTPSILIVDDDALLSEVYAATLEEAGMHAHIANDAAAAFALVEKLKPDLVLLDIEMPNVHGIELAKVIRQSRGNMIGRASCRERVFRAV